MELGLSFQASGAFYTSETLHIRRQLQKKNRNQVKNHDHQLTQHSSLVSSLPDSELAIVTEPVLSSGDTEVVLEKQNCCSPGVSRWTYRNVYASCASFMFNFAAFLGLQGLQSSLNEEIGTISLSVLYAFSFLVGFVTISMVRLLSTKYTLLFGYICYTIYTVANFYPRSYTLIPSSVLNGIAFTPIWAAISTHLGVSALKYVTDPSIKENFDVLITKFNGLLFLSFHVASILSNLVSSLVLFPYNSPNRTTTLGEVCNNTEAQNVSNTQLYILLSIYLLFNAAGIIILLVFVSKIPHYVRSKPVVEKKSKSRRYCLEPFTDLIKILISWKMLLLGFLSIYNGAQLSYAFSTYTQNVVSRCVGVSKVGFTLIVLGFCSATTSIVYARLVKYIHRVFIACFATVINLVFLFFLRFYPLKPSWELVFLFAIFWGIAGGIWNTLNSSVVGILFPDHQDSAYTSFRIWISLGFAVGFAIARLQTFADRIWTMLALLLVSFTTYMLLELFVSKPGKKICCKKELGIFEGPKTRLDESDDDLAGDMVDEHVGGSESLTDGIIKYTPPAFHPRSSSSFSTEAPDTNEDPNTNPTVGNDSSESDLTGQKKRLLQTAVF